MKNMTEIRWHSRGGQGAKTASLLLADAAFLSGKYVQSFPEYGPERSGAPITAYNRISDERCTIHSNIYEPDYVAVVDETLLESVDVTAGLKPEGAIIINENDTIATQEIAVGDNDSLGAIVAVCCRADLLVVLSDIEGLYSANPKEDPEAQLIPEVAELTPEIYALAGGKGSELATGGMVTKLHAAQIATSQGVTMIITNGAEPEHLYDIVEGKPVGTKFIGR